jgi:hypothetical protein
MNVHETAIFEAEKIPLLGGCTVAIIGLFKEKKITHNLGHIYTDVLVTWITKCFTIDRFFFHYQKTHEHA